MLGHKLSGYVGTPEQIAARFFTDQQQMFGLEEVAQALRLEKTSTSYAGGIRLKYRQYYKGIPVLDSGYMIAISRRSEEEVAGYVPGIRSVDDTDYTRSDGAWYIYFVNGDYYPDVKVSTMPNLSAEDAALLAQQGGAGSGLEAVTATQLAIHVDETENNSAYRLVYALKGQTVSGGAWSALIDALTGEIIRQGPVSSGVVDSLEDRPLPSREEPAFSLVDAEQGVFAPFTATASLPSQVTAYGNVYKTYPGNSSVTNQSFKINSGSPSKLDGTHMVVLRGDGSSVATSTSSPPTFNYSTSNAHFDEVMAYYHTYNFREWLKA